MKLTPLDIHHKEFRRAIRGYNEEEVDVFLDQVAEEFERVFKENIELKEQVEGMKDKVKQYEGVEQTLQKALLTAQKAADEVQNNAQKESELIIKDAELKAKEIIQQVLTEKQNMQNELSALKDAEKDFRDKFKNLLSQYLDVISKVEKGEHPRVAEAPVISEVQAAPEPAAETEAEEPQVEPVSDEPFRAAFGSPEPEPVSDEQAPTEETPTSEEPEAAAKSPDTDGEPTRDFAVEPEPEAQEPEPKIEFGAVPPDIGAGASSFFGDAKDTIKAFGDESAVVSSDSEFKVTFDATKTPSSGEELTTEPEGGATTAVVEVPPPASSEPEPNPAAEPQSQEPDGPTPSVSSFFDDDLGVDEEEKKDDWSMLTAPADENPDQPKKSDMDVDDSV